MGFLEDIQNIGKTQGANLVPKSNSGIPDSLSETVGEVRSTEVPINEETGLPQYVVDSSRERELVKKSVDADHEIRTQNFLAQLTSSQAEVNQARDNIDNIPVEPIGEILGLFNKDYDREHQQNIIAKSISNVQTQGVINNKKRELDQIKVANAGADFDEYLNLQTAAGKIVTQRSAILDFRIKSAQFDEIIRKSEFAKLSPQEIITAHKTQSGFDKTLTPQAASTFVSKRTKAIADAKSANLAFRSGDLKLAREMEDYAIEQMPLNVKLELLQEFTKSGGKGQITFGDAPISSGKLRAAINKDEIEAKTLLDRESTRAAKNFANDAAFMTIMRDVGILSGSFNNTGNLKPFEGLNRGNLTPENVEKISEVQMDPRIREDFMNLVFHTSNEKLSGQDFKTFKATQDKLVIKVQEGIKRIQEADIDSQPTKELKAAQKDWFVHGEVTNKANAANVVASLGGFSPKNLSPDAQLSWNTYAQNVFKKLKGEELKLGEKDADGNVTLDAISLMEAQLAPLMPRLKKNPDIVAEAMLPDENGASPQSVGANFRRRKAMNGALMLLVNDFPELKPQIFEGGTTAAPRFLRKAGELAITLAKISAGKQRNDPTKPDNFMNLEFAAKLNKYYEENAPAWEHQVDLESGSFQHLLYANRSALQLTESSVRNHYSKHTQDAWKLALQELGINVTQKDAASQPPAAVMTTPNAL